MQKLVLLWRERCQTASCQRPPGDRTRAFPWLLLFLGLGALAVRTGLAALTSLVRRLLDQRMGTSGLCGEPSSRIVTMSGL